MHFNQPRRAFLRGLAGSAVALSWPGFVLAEPAGGNVLFLRPGDKGYDDHTALFNSTIVRRPALVAVCLDEAGVMQAVVRARTEGLPVAVKGGGHSFEGFSLNDGGFVIDVSLMTSHALHPDGRYVADPACRLVQAWEYLVPQHRMVPLGSCAMVGIGGLTLGGGYGIFSREHGLACDALQSLRIVDGRGELHQVSAGSELFRACRGGGNGNFGVVTQLQYATVPAPAQLWRHFFKVRNVTAARALECAVAWFDATADLPDSAFSAFVLNHTTLNILVTNSAPDVSPSLAAVLKRLEAIADQRYADRKEDTLHGIRRYYGRMTPLPFKNASAGYYRGFDDIRAAAPALFGDVVATPGLLYQINTLGGAISRLDDGTHTAYVHRDARYLGEIQSYWEHPADAPGLRRAVAQFEERLRDAGVREHYCNYPDLAYTDWATAYYGADGYRRLQKVKAAHDPDNLFRHPQSVRA